MPLLSPILCRRSSSRPYSTTSDPFSRKGGAACFRARDSFQGKRVAAALQSHPLRCSLQASLPALPQCSHVQRPPGLFQRHADGGGAQPGKHAQSHAGAQEEGEDGDGAGSASKRRRLQSRVALPGADQVSTDVQARSAQTSSLYTVHSPRRPTRKGKVTGS